MHIYQLHSDLNYNECTEGVHRLFPDQFRLPALFCPTCNAKHSWGSCYPIPEADLYYNHPIFNEIREIRHKLKEQARKANREFIKKFNKDANILKDEAACLEYERAGTLSPLDFHSIASRVREVLSLPDDRKIGPYAQLGLRDEIVCFHDTPEIKILDDYCPTIIIRQNVIDALISINATGWNAYPVNIIGVVPCHYSKSALDIRIRQFIVTGSGGFPANYNRQFYGEETCPECGYHREWLTEGGETQILDEDAWDGSDFFTLPITSGVFVTERIKDLFEENEFSGCLFRLSTMPFEEWKTTVRDKV